MTARLALLALLLGANAAAQPHLDPDEEIAHRHFDRGRAYYEEGRYPNALAEFEAARRARELPAFDFNIGRCLDRMERFADAIEAYQRYVDSTPTPDDADEVRARIGVLRKRVAATAPVRAGPAAPVLVAAPPPRPPPPPPSHRKTLIAVLVSVGVAVVTGVAVGLAVGLDTTTEAPTPATLGVRRGTP